MGASGGRQRRSVVRGERPCAHVCLYPFTPCLLGFYPILNPVVGPQDGQIAAPHGTGSACVAVCVSVHLGGQE